MRNDPEVKALGPDRKAELLRLAAAQGEFTTQQAIEALGISRKSVIEHLNELVWDISKEKAGRGKYHSTRGQG